MKAARQLVFVYGTLMRGEHHHNVMGTSPFVGEALTLPEFELHLVEYYPALVRGGRTAVRGELFEVELTTLARLDELEEHPEFYVRERISLANGGAAITYVLPAERLPARQPIPSGDFRLGRPRPPGAGDR